MITLAILHPTGLLADELRGSLARRRELWREILLLSDLEDEIGTLTDIGGAAAMVTPLEEDSLERADVVFFCGPIANTRPLLERLPPGTMAIVLSPDAEADDGRPLVAGVNLEHTPLDAIRLGAAAISPHPATILLAHLLGGLRDFYPTRASATLLQPSSMHDRTGLDEVLEQSRAILSFAADTPRDVFKAQIAFNAIPSLLPAPPIHTQLAAILGDEAPDIACQIVQTSIFHSFGASLLVELDEDPGEVALREALARSPMHELAVDPELLGPIDAANSAEILIGSVTAAPGQPGAYWIWAVMDNLTRGGALNAIAILETITAHSIVH